MAKYNLTTNLKLTSQAGATSCWGQMKLFKLKVTIKLLYSSGKYLQEKKKRIYHYVFVRLCYPFSQLREIFRSNSFRYIFRMKIYER